MTTHNVVMAGSFDDLCSQHLRFLAEATRLGQVQVLAWEGSGAGAAAGKLRDRTRG